MWFGLALVVVVCYDVLTRYFGVPKPFGLNSTMVQESEYWLHTFLFALLIGYTYTKQGHVRIDLVRTRLRPRGRAFMDLFSMTVLSAVVTLIAWQCWPVLANSLSNGSTANTPLETPLAWVQTPWLLGWVWFAVV
ncbi:MAG: TRAP transporter small permease subunit, partial [Pseudomonadota bacterium]